MRYSTEDFEASKFLGNAVGKNNPFMRAMACMALEEREIYSYLEVAELWANMTKEEEKEFKKVKKTMQLIGQAKFQMDIVSHLSMKADVDEGFADAH